MIRWPFDRLRVLRLRSLSVAERTPLRMTRRDRAIGHAGKPLAENCAERVPRNCEQTPRPSLHCAHDAARDELGFDRDPTRTVRCNAGVARKVRAHRSGVDERYRDAGAAQFAMELLRERFYGRFGRAIR